MTKLSDYTIALLNDVEERIIPEVEERYFSLWDEFWRGECRKSVFSPMREIVSQPGIKIENININDAINDYELMLDMQLANVSAALAKGKGVLSMRANYGTGILSSLFGAEIFEMPREMNTLPTTRAFNDSDVIRQILDKGIPNFENGFGKRVFDFGEMCLDIFKDYPKISKYVYMYHPDTQGPLDIAELLWGSELFYALYDDPDLVHGMMQLITDTYVGFLDKWFLMYPNRKDLNAHWGFLMKGNICLRDDSAMNLSPDFYREFALKYDRYLLDHYGGGVVHFCGRGDHYIDILASVKSLVGVNISQPHLNDMDKIYGALLSNNKKILSIPKAAAEEYEKRSDRVPSMVHT